MATYVISDIHGHYDMFMELLEKIDLKDSDDLFILGDVIDRGPDSIKTLLKLMDMPNAFPIIGNHELMGLPCLRFLLKDITEETLSEITDELAEMLFEWQINGGLTTINEFRRLDPETRLDILFYLGDFTAYESIKAGGRNYLLVHGGLGNYDPDKPISQYELDDLVWERADFETRYFPDKFVVTGHTPTQCIEDNPRPGYIYRKNGHIAIDCGCHLPGGRLAAICLDTDEEFYSSENPILWEQLL